MNSRIYIKDWLELKPYDKQTKTDAFYLKVCNDVKKAIVSSKNLSLVLQHLSKKDIDLLSCFLTSYLEDVISDTNIWKSFMRMHLKQYQKHLPFYQLNNYDEKEINVQDIAFLTWYFINTIQNEAILSPFISFIGEISGKIIDIFDDAWEFAPENEYLKSFYVIEEDEDDFYIARKLIDTLLFKTYLFYPDTVLKLQKQEMEIIENQKIDDYLFMLLNENRESALHTMHTRLLSLKGKDWVAEIVGQEHGLHKHYLNISKRVFGFFLYKGQDDKTIFLEHIATGMKFDLAKKSFDHADTLSVEDTILYIGMVRWKDEWWFSGIHFQNTFNAQLVADEKNSLESRAVVNFLDPRAKDNDEMLQNQLSVFKQLNNGKQIAFMPSNKIDKFIEEFTVAYNKSLKFSEKEREETMQRARADGFLGKTDNRVDFSKEEVESGLVFLNEKSGIEVVLDLNAAFPLSWNPYYNEEKSEEDIIYLMTDNSISTELTQYCIDNCKDKLAFFKKDIGKIYLRDLDFILRFWKGANYYSEPSITHTGVMS